MKQEPNQLTARVLAYLEATGMKPTRFGKEVAKDASLVANLLTGREPRWKLQKQIIEFIESHPPGKEAAE
jgi:hypothetical protein